MKAYYLWIEGDDDAGGAITFANTAREAKKNYYKYEWLADALGSEWIYLRARRDKRYDGMEKLDAAHLALEQWHDGWRWFDTEYPNVDEATDEDFLKWYKENFK